ncbi:Short chain dehydrogenase [Rasamsonia emersonii CBS 393.64]|uniref:Short chain dehydrogenase n=1 Tax=Rasamsonia emersonii (strain ATCC 16479 / CBS 393.64 / IMI 116815) TaxID=1408163 RepID=A0A0F4YT84_RASE3|nr:Short chain dehydrogenase [Rasamsonia emersonii CBS 393.64]KKA21502.1 Short chain dehydrogenase [Rasamsonia emersonii CBS 393.64]
MPYELKGRNVLVTGGSRGLGALVAEKFAAEGSNIAINYVSNADRAKETAAKIESQYKVKVVVIQGEVKLIEIACSKDAGIREDCVRVVRTAIESLGGLDVVISNAGWTKFSNFSDLDALTEEEWDKCWATNVKGNLHLFREALPTFNANPEGGAFIITSSTAGISPSGSSMAYSVTKAAGLHLMKCLAQTQGPKVRVNAVLPGLLLTEWGNRFSPAQIEGYKDRTSLKKIVDLDDAASIYVSIAKNASMTGQSIQIDSGFVIR